MSADAIPAEEGGGLSWAYAAALILLLHAAMAVIFPDKIWTTPVGAGSTCLLGLMFCLHCSGAADPAMRLRWALLASVFLLWLGAYAAIAWILNAGQDEGRVHIDSLLYTLRGVPLLLLLAQSGVDHDRRALIGDSVQATLFALLIAALLYPGLVQGDESARAFSDTRAIAYHDVQNFGLAVLSLLALGRSGAPDQRRFDFALAVLLVTYAVDAWLLNHLRFEQVPAPPPGSPVNIAADLPVLAFLLVFADIVQPPRPLADRRLALVLALVLPVAYCCASVLAAMAIFPRWPVVAIIGAVVAILLFAVRSAIAQARLMEARRKLSEARDSLRTLANLDALTQLPNRRFFDDRLEAEWRRSARLSGMVAIALIDVDRFKSYNDSEGHQAGDQCLRRVADLMRACVRREGDCLARYGGEEFALIAPVADVAAARALAEKIRAAVEQSATPHVAAPLGIVTISIGLTVCRATTAVRPQAMLKLADQALYEAKTSGRNRVVARFPD